MKRLPLLAALITAACGFAAVAFGAKLWAEANARELDVYFGVDQRGMLVMALGALVSLFSFRLAKRFTPEEARHDLTFLFGVGALSAILVSLLFLFG